MGHSRSKKNSLPFSCESAFTTAISNFTLVKDIFERNCHSIVTMRGTGTLTLFFPMFPFDPPENIIKPKVKYKV